MNGMKAVISTSTTAGRTRNQPLLLAKRLSTVDSVVRLQQSIVSVQADSLGSECHGDITVAIDFLIGGHLQFDRMLATSGGQQAKSTHFCHISQLHVQSGALCSKLHEFRSYPQLQTVGIAVAGSTGLCGGYRYALPLHH